MSHFSSKLRRLVGVAIALPMAFAAAGPALADPHHHSGSPGAPSIDDPLFPGLGNGGYDVRHTRSTSATRPRTRSRPCRGSR